ncbi:hypothetical protein [Pseudomonas sp. A6]|uniref:hypothetical protein n=1 Tax=Pseudomonas sp. A6 TaxID=410021 RepID=UPI0040273D84
MEISGNAFSTGLQGLQRSLQQVDRAAAQVAAQPVAKDDIARPMVDMEMSKYAALASSRVLQTADETLGTLIDISV